MKPPEIFVRLAKEKFGTSFVRLRKNIQNSGLGIVPDIYLGRMLYFTVLAFGLTIVYSTIVLWVLGAGLAAPFFGLFASVISGAVIFLMFYSYPSYLFTIRTRSIEANLPFAANHMGALAASGVPPHVIFRMLTDANEYGEIANEARRIVRNVDLFGMDVVSAVRQVAERTPSPQLRSLLMGIASTITTGGDMRQHLQQAARETLSEYRTKRKRYLSTLGTYADFYVGVLIAAPLFFVSVLSMLAIIGGQIAGLSIPAIITLGIYVVIPLLNIIFILFVHLTQPPM
jgi:flagellar protein FlaJ